MTKDTSQIKRWKGKFGKDYTNRNALSLRGVDNLYKKNYGITRSQIIKSFLGNLDRDIRILEVGSNVGNQLLLLQENGFKNLYGIEINDYAIQFSKSRTKNINIVQGSALDIPFRDGFFDLVFTSGVLIHIHPKDIKKAMKEIYRSSSRYIWGSEYYSKDWQEINYRGEKSLLWKTDYARLYLDSFSGLKLIKEKRLKYLNNDNLDTVFLLKKHGK
jgi:pseudaminic acid biosynthesis-associated methylase